MNFHDIPALSAYISSFKRNKTLINGGLFSLFSFFGKGMSFVLLILLAGYIQPKEYGQLSLFSTVETFLTYFMALSSAGYLSVSYFKKGLEEFCRDLSSVFIMGLGSLLFFALLLVIGGNFFGNVLSLPLPVLWVAVIIPFSSMVFNMQQNIYRMQENLKMYGIFNCGNALLNFIFSLFLVITLAQSWYGRIEAQLCCSLLFGLLALALLIQKHYFSFDLSWDRFKRLALWGIPLIPHLGAIWVRRGLDQYIINYHYSFYEVGIFSFALNVVGVIIMVGSAFNDSNSVSIFNILSDKSLTNDAKKNQLRQQSRNILIIIIFATVAIFLSVIGLIYFLLPKYRPAIPYFCILSVYGFIQCVYFLFCNYLFYYSKTRQLMYITLGTSFFHLGLSLLLTPYSLFLTAIVYVFIQILIVVLVAKRSYDLINVHLSTK